MQIKRFLMKMFEVPSVNGSKSASLSIMKSIILGGVVLLSISSAELRSQCRVNIAMILIYVTLIIISTSILYAVVYCAPPRLKEIFLCSFFIVFKLGSIEIFIAFCSDGLLLLSPSMIVYEWSLLTSLSIGTLKFSLAGASGIYEIMRVSIAVYVQQYRRIAINQWNTFYS